MFERILTEVETAGGTKKGPDEDKLPPIMFRYSVGGGRSETYVLEGVRPVESTVEESSSRRERRVTYRIGSIAEDVGKEVGRPVGDKHVWYFDGNVSGYRGMAQQDGETFTFSSNIIYRSDMATARDGSPNND